MMSEKQDAPQLVLHGHNYEMVKPKVKNWYDFAKFEDSIEDLSVAEYIHGTAECIASMYEGVTAEDVEQFIRENVKEEQAFVSVIRPKREKEEKSCC